MASSATELTIGHYLRPEVKETILKWCMNGGVGSRTLNADEHWYKGGKDRGTVMLRGPADYEATIERGRTLYATIDILEQSVFEQTSPWDKEKGRPEEIPGDLSNCLAFTLSTDIDGLGDIRRDLSVKKAVEDAAQFHVDYLKKMGISKSVYCLQSGGGIYVHVHHGLFTADDIPPETRRQEFDIITRAYNGLLADVERAFFRGAPGAHKKGQI